MPGERDLYAVLGVPKGVSDAELRRAYRRLARKHHPDVNPGDKAAEERFKEISAAHDVLSNPEKRKLYDEFGEVGLKEGFDPERARAYGAAGRQQAAGGGEPDVGFDLGDLFESFGGRFGEGFGGFGRGVEVEHDQARGEDLLAAVELDLADALAGSEINVSVPEAHPCAACHGSGVEPGTSSSTCPDCQGAGKKQVARGPMRLLTTCGRCHGSGVLKTPCRICGGAGRVAKSRSLKVRIPKGADSGDRLRVTGRGAPGREGGPPGDLVIDIRVRAHPHFRREGLDLYLALPVTLYEAYQGATVEVPTPSGPVKLKVPPRSQPGTELRLKQKGVHRGKQRGDLYVRLELRLPDRDDEAVRRAIEATRAAYSRPVRDALTL